MLERLIRLETYLADTLKIPTEAFAVAIERFKASAEFNDVEQFERVGVLEFQAAPSQHDFKIRRDYVLSVRIKNQGGNDALLDNLLAWLYGEGLKPSLNGMLERNNQQTFDLFIDMEVTEFSRNNSAGKVVTC